MATFGVALIWDDPRQARAAGGFVKDLVESFPKEDLTRLEVVGLARAVTLHLEIDFGLYSRARLNAVEEQVQAAGGHFVELLRIGEADRERFRQQFLTPPEGEPRQCESYAEASRLIEAHLGGLGGIEAPAPQPAAAAPAPKPAPAPPRPAAKTASGPEQRRHPRYDIELEVGFKTEAEFTKEYTSNISKGGLFLRSAQRPQTNTFALLRMELPNGKTLETVARIVHVLDHPEFGGIGLAFEKTDAAFARALDEYIATLPRAEAR